jgi:hypothetical protein
MTRRVSCLVVALAAYAFALCTGGRADAARVVVNGTALPAYPAPIDRAGRLYVPLRAIFEALGAGVVYSSGIINATSGSQTVSLSIGSTVATVDGRREVLDAPPFIVGATTYVPLRFVSQALGASVNYDGATAIAYVDKGGPPPRPVVPPRPNPPPNPIPAESVVHLRNHTPSPGAQISGTQPVISADFSHRVKANSVRVFVDGGDVTGSSERTDTGVEYTPRPPLRAGRHTVRISGTDSSGARFDRSWSFSTIAAPPATKNFVTVSSPQPNASVPRTFTVSGSTLPNASVRIVAGRLSGNGMQDAFNFLAGSVTTDVTADIRGNFSRQITINLPSAGAVGLTVTSTARNTNQTAQARRRLNGMVPQPR